MMAVICSLAQMRKNQATYCIKRSPGGPESKACGCHDDIAGILRKIIQVQQHADGYEEEAGEGVSQWQHVSEAWWL